MKGKFFTTPKQKMTIFNKQSILVDTQVSTFSNTASNILHNYIPHETKFATAVIRLRRLLRLKNSFPEKQAIFTC